VKASGGHGLPVEARRAGAIGNVIRRATQGDVARIFEIRNSVRENKLDDPARVTVEDVQAFIADTGMFVWEDAGQVVGFSAADPRDGSIWALFVDPAFEGRGIGRALFERACAVLWQAGYMRLWLTTDRGTRAEAFYRAAGWEVTAIRGNELVFETVV
jgi:GNAT superfamily N-acetyltransferase